ncbi:hypothetical protein C8Q79DRAFT_911610 [Trametes meyenii]|nr:hypothetical protein C8Q79DRAFT_911610 [Trametes meyenii]
MSQDSSDSVRAFVNDVAPVDDEGRVVCYHHLPAKRLTSHTPTNPERDFYACSKSSNDKDRCKFFVWADNPALCSAIQSKSKKSTPNMHLPSTPQRPSQASRAFFARSPTLAAASSKRQRAASPGRSSSPTDNLAGSAKHRRVESSAGNSALTACATPTTSYSCRTERVSDSQYSSQDAQKAARLKSIQDALLSASQAPRNPGPASYGGSYRREHARGASPSPQHADVPANSTPPSLSQNLQNTQNFSRYTQETQSDDGASTYIENELAEMEDMESKAIQTSPIDDESSIIEDFWSRSPPRSALGSPVLVADLGIGSSRASQYRQMPQASGVDNATWSPAPPQTPGRGGLSRASAPGGNGGDVPPGMLLTPPGSSQPQSSLRAGAGPSTPQRGRALLEEMLASPSASKGKGPAHASLSQQQWQPLRDDPSIPEYIAKLERREKASRKSAEIKGRKISQLEEELHRLRNEKRALEETVAALQMRR